MRLTHHARGHFAQAVVRNRIPGGFDMNVNILTSGYWPSYPIVDAKMPAELSDYQQVHCWTLHQRRSILQALFPRQTARWMHRAQGLKGAYSVAVALSMVTVGRVSPTGTSDATQ